MFIIQRRAAGVLAALATTAAMVVLGNVWEPVDEIQTAHIAASTPALMGSVGLGIGDNCFPGDRAGAEVPVTRGDAKSGGCGDLNVR